jgi:tetratricopeptide (TPR) repeat protein
MNKRLQMLEKVTAAGQGDSFAWYALAMEYRKEQRVDEALSAFQALRERDPNYLAMYLMAGQLLIESGRTDEARGWLEQGIELARRQSESRALSELETALASL